MRWQFWRKEDDDSRKYWTSNLPNIGLQNDAAATSTWTTAEVARIAAFLPALYLLRQGYKRFVRRIPNIDHIKPEIYRKRSLYGYVTRVGDGDNFRFYHTPGGRLLGWRWLPGRKPQNLAKADLTDNTIHVRVAGVDAPECAHFGRKEQPFGRDAMAWLGDTVEGKYVRVWPYSRDRFDRTVASVKVRLPWRPWSSDLGLRMIQSGCATVYEAKTGSEFGGREEQYREAEEQAKRKGVGMWKEPGIVEKMLGKTASKVETPREYKTRMKKSEEAEGK